jgi:hypothetical protein
MFFHHSRHGRRVIALCLAAALHFPLFADSLSIRYAAEMTRLPAGSDVVGLGENGVALPRHAVSSFWNPAAPAFTRNYEFSAEFADLYEGMSQQACIAMMVPLSEGLGASILYMPFFSGPISLQDSLPGTYQSRLGNTNLRADGSSQGVFSNNQHLVAVAIGKVLTMSMPRSAGTGYPLPLEVGVGCSFKTFWQTMNPNQQTRMGMNVNLDAGLGVRIGLDYNLTRKAVSRELFLGVSVRDLLPSPVIWINSRDEYNSSSEYREEVTRSYYSGIVYVDKSNILGANWTLLVAMDRLYQTAYQFGVEAQFWNTIAFRIGLSDQIPTIGAGITYGKYFLDYSFKFDELAYSYVRLTAGIRM